MNKKQWCNYGNIAINLIKNPPPQIAEGVNLLIIN